MLRVFDASLGYRVERNFKTRRANDGRARIATPTCTGGKPLWCRREAGGGKQSRAVHGRPPREAPAHRDRVYDPTPRPNRCL